MSRLLYNSVYTGKEFDEYLGRIKSYVPDIYGYEIIPSTVDEPVNISTLIKPGNYVIYHYKNAPDGVEYSPLIVRVAQINNEIMQTITDTTRDVFIRSEPADIKEFSTEWTRGTKSTYIPKGVEEPDSPKVNDYWIKQYIDEDDNIQYMLLIYDGAKWNPASVVGVMLKSVYDKNGRNANIYEYIQYAKTDGSTNMMTVSEDIYEFESHIASTSSHITLDERAIFASKLSMDDYESTINEKLTIPYIINPRSFIEESRVKMEETASSIQELDKSILNHSTRNSTWTDISKSNTSVSVVTSAPNGTVIAGDTNGDIFYIRK